MLKRSKTWSRVSCPSVPTINSPAGLPRAAATSVRFWPSLQVAKRLLFGRLIQCRLTGILITKLPPSLQASDPIRTSIKANSPPHNWSFVSQTKLRLRLNSCLSATPEQLTRAFFGYYAY